MRILFSALILIVSLNTYAQSLHKERIWKITSRKRSIFFDKGIFHSDVATGNSVLKDIRNSYVKSRGYERIVFDFDTKAPPRVYGHISAASNIVRVDLFNTKIAKKINQVRGNKYLKEVKFFNVNDKNLSLEMSFKDQTSFDVFYLENPGRLVIDVKI